MIGFQKQEPTRYGGIEFPSDAFLNENFSKIQRGRYEYFSLYSDPSYIPPTILMYTMVNLKIYFLVFWIILFLQTIVIYIFDQYWIKPTPLDATFLERIMHAHLKSHFPFPYFDWDFEKGSCQDYIQKQKKAKQEVGVATLINLLSALLMTIPLMILCKIFMHLILIC